MSDVRTPPQSPRQAYMTAGQTTSLPAKGSRGLGGARGFEREKDDFYPTPPALIEPLVARWRAQFDEGVWEPACGDGAICKVLEKHRIPSVGSDLVDRGYGTPRRDFLLEHKVPDGLDALITNPPFSLWRQFAERALSLDLGFVALLGRLQLLEGKRMSALFQQTRLSEVMVSAGRVNMLPSGAVDKGFNGMIAWAWFVWVPYARDQGAPRVVWFTPQKEPRDA